MSHAALALPQEAVVLPATHPWARLPLVGAAAAALGLLGCAALGLRQPAQLSFSWLVAFLYVLTIALGCLFFVLMHTAAQGGWGIVIRRVAENAAATLPVLAVLFVPVLLGMPHLYPWSREGAAAADPLLRAKASYLNSGFFTVRAVVCLVTWAGIALWCAGLSRRQDAVPDHALAARLRRLSGPLLIPMALTTTVAAVDWVMSLDPHWYSTMFGVYVFAGALVGAFAFLSLAAVALPRAGLLRGVVTTEHLHDLGKLLFAFTVFWAYIAFSQFFLIWYGNIPEETLWLRDRLHGSWLTLTVLLAVGHFGLPFFFLMSRAIKRNPATLAAGAAWLLVMHLVDVYWLVMPSLHEEGVAPSLLDLCALLAVGGVFLAAFGRALRQGPLVPLGDPRLPESLGFENV